MENLDGELRGILWKKGARFRGWKKRLFVAKDGTISYYKHEDGKGTPAGSFPISNAGIKLMHTNDKDGINGHRFGITPAGSDRCYLLQSAESEVRDTWIAFVIHHGGKWVSEENVYRGYLWKKGNVNTNWKKRFFVVEKGEFRWYEDAREKKKLGTIELSDALVCVFDPNLDQELYEKEDRSGLLFSIKPKKSERTFLLETDTKSDLDNWLKVLPAQLESVVEKQICTLALCLQNRVGRELLIQFAKERQCDENVLFWLEAEAYKNLPRNSECLVPAAEQLCDTFIRPGSPMEIGYLSHPTRTKLLQSTKAGDCPEDLFVPCQRLLFSHLDQSLFPDFRSSPLYQLAIKRLGEEEVSILTARAKIVHEGLIEYRQELKNWKNVYLVATSADLSFFSDASKTLMTASFSLKQAKAVFLGEEIYFEEGKTIPGGFPFGLSFFGENKTRVYHVYQEKARVSWLSAFREIGLEMLDAKNVKKDPSKESVMEDYNFGKLREKGLGNDQAHQANNLHDLFKQMTGIYTSPATADLLSYSKMLKDPPATSEKQCLFCKSSAHRAIACQTKPSDELLDLNRIRKLCDVLSTSYHPALGHVSSASASLPAQLAPSPSPSPSSASAAPAIPPPPAEDPPTKCQCANNGATCVPMVVKSLVQCRGDQVLQSLWRAAFQNTTTELAAHTQRWLMRLVWQLGSFAASSALDKCWGGKKMSTRVPFVETVRVSNTKISAVYHIWRDDGLESKFIPKKLSEISQFYDTLGDLLKGIVELPFITKVKRPAVHETACMMRLQLDAAFENLTSSKVYPLILVTEKAREHFYNFLQVKSGANQLTPEFFELHVTAACLTHQKERTLPTLVLDILQQILCGVPAPRNLPVLWTEKDAVEEHRKELKECEGHHVSNIKEPFVVPLVLAACCSVPITKTTAFLYELNHLLIVHPVNSKQIVRPGFAASFLQLLFSSGSPSSAPLSPTSSPPVDLGDDDSKHGGKNNQNSSFALDDDVDEDPEKPQPLNEVALHPLSLSLNILVLCLQYHLLHHTSKGSERSFFLLQGKSSQHETMGSMLSSTIVRMGCFKIASTAPNSPTSAPATGTWSPLHIRMIQKLVGALIGKLSACIAAFRFQEDHPGWTNLFDTLNVLRNLTWLPIEETRSAFASLVDEESVNRSAAAIHLKSTKPPHLDYQEGRILLTESALRSLITALKGLKLFDMDISAGETRGDVNNLKNLKGEGLAFTGYFADCLVAFRTARGMDPRTAFSQPTVSFRGPLSDDKKLHQSDLFERVVIQFYCSYFFDRSYSKEVDERLAAFDNKSSRGLSRGLSMTEDQKVMYLLSLGVPVYTITAKKVKQCLLSLKEKEHLGTLKRKEDEGKAIRYNLVIEHRRKKRTIPLVDAGSQCQFQCGVSAKERLSQYGLDYGKEFSFSILQPKKKWALDCVCFSPDRYVAWIKGLTKLLGDSSHAFCECGGAPPDAVQCSTCGRPVRDHSALTRDFSMVSREFSILNHSPSSREYSVLSPSPSSHGDSLLVASPTPSPRPKLAVGPVHGEPVREMTPPPALPKQSSKGFLVVEKNEEKPPPPPPPKPTGPKLSVVAEVTRLNANVAAEATPPRLSIGAREVPPPPVFPKQMSGKLLAGPTVAISTRQPPPLPGSLTTNAPPPPPVAAHVSVENSARQPPPLPVPQATPASAPTSTTTQIDGKQALPLPTSTQESSGSQVDSLAPTGDSSVRHGRMSTGERSPSPSTDTPRSLSTGDGAASRRDSSQLSDPSKAAPPKPPRRSGTATQLEISPSS